jgi:hypothetical protein
MSDVPPSFPEEGALFEGDREERFLAVALETLVQDVSPVGDADVARSLGGYSLGDEPPPDEAPEYVSLEDGRITLTNPPFLLAEVEYEAHGHALRCEFDSELKLLIEPPVEVTLEAASFDELLEAFEQMIAEIYRTRGRRLEMLHEGVVDPGEFAERR